MTLTARLALTLTLWITAGLLAAPMVRAQQDIAYIRVEAQPTLARAQVRVRDYAAVLPDVGGFALGSGWYAIALGPYSRVEAEQRLLRLRALGDSPRDSFIAGPAEFERQFWPIGAQLPDAEAPATLAPPEAEAPQPEPAPTFTMTPQVQPDDQPAPEPFIPEETLREARASEARLTRPQKEELQIALTWAGHYRAGIDGAFGRGTRAAMAAWQREQGLEPTGVLTTRQRAQLLEDYYAVLKSVGMRGVTDRDAGIRIDLPLAVLREESRESPFVAFGPSGALQARALLISQTGDRDTLGGLYEIMQTLEIVPREGERRLRRDGFTLTGRNSRIVSTTEVQLQDGQIKGYTLVWPAGDEDRRSRVWQAMQASFERLPGVLPAAALADSGVQVDLVSGLQVRRPRLSRSGVFIDTAGSVMTVAEAVTGCGEVMIDRDTPARVVAVDTDRGLAVLRPEGSGLRPVGVAQLRNASLRIGTELAVSGYSYEGVLPAPTLTFGAVTRMRLPGQPRAIPLDMAPLDGDTGGPLLDDRGSVVGLLAPLNHGARRLPDGMAMGISIDDMRAMMETARIFPTTDGGAATRLAPEDLTRRGADITALVSCWD